eukprot:9503827-Pyramimonas_sp.AAC.2
MMRRVRLPKTAPRPKAARACFHAARDAPKTAQDFKRIPSRYIREEGLTRGEQENGHQKSPRGPP